MQITEKMNPESDPVIRDASTDEEKELVQAAAEIEENLQALADREAAKASALAKLEALGLTTEEAQAIAGI